MLKKYERWLRGNPERARVAAPLALIGTMWFGFLAANYVSALLRQTTLGLEDRIFLTIPPVVLVVSFGLNLLMKAIDVLRD